MKDEERSHAGEDWFEGEEDRSVGRRKVLLGPTLDGKRGGSGEEAGDGERDYEPWGDGDVRSSAQWQRESHDKRGYADLDGRELGRGNLMRSMGEGEEMASEGDGADEGEEVPRTDADEEPPQRGSRGRGEKQ